MKKNVLFTLLLTAMTTCLFAQASFTDIAEDAGVANDGNNYGVAFGDFDNDGWDDMYISRHNGPNLLYKNNGDGTFAEVGENAGVNYEGKTRTAVWGDIDNDGWLDLYVGNTNETNILYRNLGDGTFEDISETANVQSVGDVRSAMFADVNGDGFLDIYVANLSAQNAFYRNMGDNTFINMVFTSGATDMQIAMGSIFFDYDNDGDQDLYLTHDANQPYIMYRNDGAGNFTDVSEETNTNYAGQGMGVDVGDFNNDGWFDIYITNLYNNTLLINDANPDANGQVTFTDISEAAGIDDLGMGWGITIFDYDNDGLQDIYMVNDSHFAPYSNILYRNLGDFNFENVSDGTPLYSMLGGYGVATSDINQDGLLDIFLANNGMGGVDNCQLFLNENHNEHSWVQIKTVGTESNRSGIGARVEVEANGSLFIDEVCGGASFVSQNSLTLHFGLGEAEMIDRVTVKWPSGAIDVYENLDVNRLFVVTEGESMVTGIENTQAAVTSLTNYPNPFTNTTQFDYTLDRTQHVSIAIFDMAGKMVIKLIDEHQQAGTYSVEWDATNAYGSQVAEGAYFCKLMFNGKQQVVKLMYTGE